MKLILHLSIECANSNIRLVGGGELSSRGRIETCENNTWTAVVSPDSLNYTAASVVCSSLGYSPYGMNY